jgi:bifunctional DNA-binding transcriptional regulator/antitoxin component of YhaV-PrlF toxin-antitoxin module
LLWTFNAGLDQDWPFGSIGYLTTAYIFKRLLFMKKLKTDTAIVTPQGYIALPKKALELLKVSVGDSITFIYEDGYVIMSNPTIFAFRKMQKLMEGEFEKVGINSDQDILEICLQIRKEVEDN